MRRPRLSYANVIATIALLLAISGGIAWAALGRDTVRAKQIAPNAVGTSELRTGAAEQANIDYSAVGSPEVIDRSLGAQDQLELYTVDSPEVFLGTFGSGNSVDSAQASCGTTGEVVSGGHDTGIRTFITFSKKVGNTWVVIGVNSSDTLTSELQATAFCRPYGQAPAVRRQARSGTAAERADYRRALQDARSSARELGADE